MNKRIRKILLLGGSSQQVCAIEAANSLGIQTILCDYLPDNPGRKCASKYYNASTTEIQAIKEIAFQEKIDGILAFASEPAAYTAAVVAEELNLPGNKKDAVAICSNKGLFREFQTRNDLPSPKYMIVQAGCEAEKTWFEKNKKYIVKPIDSSGSKGVSVVGPFNGDFYRNCNDALRKAQKFSRTGAAIIEEYLNYKNQIIGGDIYVHDGRIVLWGLMDCIRDPSSNMLVPAGKKYPPDLNDQELQLVKETIRKTISYLGIRFGGMNLEVVLTKEDDETKAVILDIGARSGGNRIPELMDFIFDSNIARWSVLDAMGIPFEIPKKEVQLRFGNDSLCYALYVLHSERDGILKEIIIQDDLTQFIIKDYRYAGSGEEVKSFQNAGCSLGILLLRFPDSKEMNRIMERIDEYVRIEYC